MSATEGHLPFTALYFHPPSPRCATPPEWARIPCDPLNTSPESTESSLSAPASMGLSTHSEATHGSGTSNATSVDDPDRRSALFAPTAPLALLAQEGSAVCSEAKALGFTHLLPDVEDWDGDISRSGGEWVPDAVLAIYTVVVTQDQRDWCRRRATASGVILTIRDTKLVSPELRSTTSIDSLLLLPKFVHADLLRHVPIAVASESMGGASTVFGVAAKGGQKASANSVGAEGGASAAGGGEGGEGGESSSTGGNGRSCDNAWPGDSVGGGGGGSEGGDGTSTPRGSGGGDGGGGGGGGGGDGGSGANRGSGGNADQGSSGPAPPPPSGAVHVSSSLLYIDGRAQGSSYIELDVGTPFGPNYRRRVPFSLATTVKAARNFVTDYSFVEMNFDMGDTRHPIFNIKFQGVKSLTPREWELKRPTSMEKHADFDLSWPPGASVGIAKPAEEFTEKGTDGISRSWTAEPISARDIFSSLHRLKPVKDDRGDSARSNGIDGHAAGWVMVGREEEAFFPVHVAIEQHLIRSPKARDSVQVPFGLIHWHSMEIPHMSTNLPSYATSRLEPFVLTSTTPAASKEHSGSCIVRLGVAATIAPSTPSRALKALKTTLNLGQKSSEVKEDSDTPSDNNASLPELKEQITPCIKRPEAQDFEKDGSAPSLPRYKV